MTTDTGPTSTHDAREFSIALAKKLSSRHRHVSFLLGAGASRAAGLPDMKGLETEIKERERARGENVLTALLDVRSLEESLTWLRRLATVLDGSSESFAGLSLAEVHRADELLCREIMDILTASTFDLTAHRQLASWLSRTEFERPVEIFTLNYDLLTEMALEDVGVPYFDGFLGNYRARFAADLVDQVPGGRSLPSYFARLWKLHGSVSWTSDDAGELVRIAAPVPGATVSAIHPSESKYNDSRRAPFVILQDRLRRSLLEPETIVLVCGYSLGDEHINEVLFDCAKARPRSEYIFLNFDGISDQLAELALSTRNITAISPTDAIIGGVHGMWQNSSATISSATYWRDGALALVDFGALTRYLAATVGLAHDEIVSAASPGAPE